MGRGDNKTLFNRILGTFRRGWSFPQIRISVIAIVIITIFLCILYSFQQNDEKYLSIYSKPLYSERQKKIDNNIACLIVADSYFMEGQASDDEHRS